jgi:hypothetical protein
MAPKQHEKRQIEAEELQHREQLQAQHDLEIAILTANKEKAVADAKLNAIEQAIQEERLALLLDDISESFDSKLRTETWINTLNQSQEQRFEQLELAQTHPNNHKSQSRHTSKPSNPDLIKMINDQPRPNQKIRFQWTRRKISTDNLQR